MSIDVKVEFPELQQLKAAFRELRPSLARKHMGAAIRRSLAPGLSALKSKTPKGPTGNLRRAIASKVKTYKSGNAVGLVGYVAAGSGKSVSAGGGKVRKGKDRAYHAGFLEFGTKERVTKGPYASSFKTLGPFKIKSTGRDSRAARRLVGQAQRLTRRADRQRFQDGASAAAMLRQRAANLLGDAASRAAASTRVQTSPAYPKAFFKRVPKGGRVQLGHMPIGGRTGQPPVKSAYKQSVGTMRSQLMMNMALSLQNALKDLAADFPSKRNEGGIGPTPF